MLVGHKIMIYTIFYCFKIKLEEIRSISGQYKKANFILTLDTGVLFC